MICSIKDLECRVCTIFKVKFCHKSQVGDLCWAELKHQWLLLEFPHRLKVGKMFLILLYTRENMCLLDKWNKSFCLPLLEDFFFLYKQKNAKLLIPMAERISSSELKMLKKEHWTAKCGPQTWNKKKKRRMKSLTFFPLWELTLIAAVSLQ